MTTTAYHSKINGQVESYTKTMVTRLRQYIAKHQENCGTSVHPLPYAYNTQVYRSVVVCSYILVSNRHEATAVTLHCSSAIILNVWKILSCILRESIEVRLAFIAEQVDS